MTKVVMSDHDKTKEELLQEINELRDRLSRAESATVKPAETVAHSLDPILRFACEQCVDAIRLTDANGTVRMLNQAYCRLVDRPREALEQMPFWVIHSAEDQKAALTSYQQQFQSRKVESRTEQRLILWNHKRVWLEISNTFIEDAGKERLLFSILRDITDRKVAQRELQANLSAYHELFENANDIFYMHDLEGNLTFLNKAGERITGYTRDEALRMNIAQILSPESAALAREMTDRQIRTQTATTYEVEIVAKDHRKAQLEVNTHVIYRKGKPIEVQGVAREITERNRLEEKLRQTQKVEAVGRLAAGVAHDFNNMLTIILGYADVLLKMSYPADFPIHLLEEIKKAGQRSEVLTRQLLAFSRKQVLQPRVLSLNAVVTDLQKMLGRIIGEDITMEVELAPDAGQIRADPGQIEQVILNLVVNARDAMPRGGSLSLQTAPAELDAAYVASHRGVRPGSYVQLTVSDTGCGMDATTKTRLFEPFFTTKELGKGTGLGLATVASILDETGGHAEVISELGQGAVFKIYFPRVREEVPEATSAPTDAPAPKGKETVLLVEDEAQVRALARMILEQHGYTVLEAQDGVDALEASTRFRGVIHLLVTDVVMPSMGGADLAMQLSQKRPDLKVLCLSGYTDSAVVRHGVMRNQIAFLQKPFTIDQFATKVREVLDK